VAPVLPRGLPPRIYVPIVVVVAAVFLTVVGVFLRSALGVTGSALGPIGQQGDANIRATSAPDTLPTSAPGEVVVPQSGGAAAPGDSVDASVGGGGPANVGGPPPGAGPPLPVQRLITEYRNRMQRDPKDLAAIVGLAQLEFDAGMFDRAIPYYVRALALDPANPDTRTDYATALHAVGHDLEAIAQLHRVLGTDPNFAAALFNDGVVANAIGRHTEAIVSFKHFLAVAPRDPRSGDARTALKNLGG